MADEERQIRFAAETLLSGSVDSQRSSYTQHSINRIPDIILSENLIAGARTNGNMSNVRRFFCLFVTFDLFFTFLMWLICTVISGQNIEMAFEQQIVYYNIKTSLFDVVMAAFCRFVVLLLFYALLYMRHWIIIALSTSLTCAFLITKVFLFDWSQSSQTGFQVLLIVTSFVIAWGEAWFFDFRVIPQETQARDWFQGSSDTERTPLLQPNLMTPDQQSENVHHFYTPMDSPDHSDREEGSIQEPQRRSGRLGSPFVSHPIRLPEHKILDYKKKGDLLINRSYELLISNNWVVDKITADGDEISYMNLPKPDGKIFKITGVIDAPSKLLLDSIFEDVDGSTKWNNQLVESKRLHLIDENTDVVYQATANHGNIQARDFVVLRCRAERNSYYISAGISISSTLAPNRKNFIRDKFIRGENGVSCWATASISDEDNNRCLFTWIMNTNLRGWIPQKIVEFTTSFIMLNFMNNLRRHARKIQDSSEIK